MQRMPFWQSLCSKMSLIIIEEMNFSLKIIVQKLNFSPSIIFIKLTVIVIQAAATPPTMMALLVASVNHSSCFGLRHHESCCRFVLYSIFFVVSRLLFVSHLRIVSRRPLFLSPVSS
jgi:hypothetical protein